MNSLRERGSNLDKRDQFFTIILIILALAVIWLVVETSTLRGRIAENESNIIGLETDLDLVRSNTIEADFNIFLWMGLVEEWIAQVNERLSEKSYY